MWCMLMEVRDRRIQLPKNSTLRPSCLQQTPWFSPASLKVPDFKKEKVMARIQNGITQNSWQFLSTSLAANARDLPHLEAHRVELADTLAKSEDLTTQLATLTASKQDISKQLAALMDNGRKLATFLRVGVKQSYGNRSEKLVEFGLQPLRTRRKLATTPPADTPPPTTTPTPAPTAPGTTTSPTTELSAQKPTSLTEATATTGSGH